MEKSLKSYAKYLSVMSGDHGKGTVIIYFKIQTGFYPPGNILCAFEEIFFELIGRRMNW